MKLPLINMNLTQGSAVSGTVTADIQFVVQSSSNTSSFDYINVNEVIEGELKKIISKLIGGNNQ